jgi:hypothetical protein
MATRPRTSWHQRFQYHPVEIVEFVEFAIATTGPLVYPVEFNPDGMTHYWYQVRDRNTGKPPAGILVHRTGGERPSYFADVEPIARARSRSPNAVQTPNRNVADELTPAVIVATFEVFTGRLRYQAAFRSGILDVRTPLDARKWRKR